jgi:2-polyprenyl-3-methyl-5-hydroxy-6-metoxy-1,4-benzoquinol methylase
LRHESRVDLTRERFALHSTPPQNRHLIHGQWLIGTSMTSNSSRTTTTTTTIHENNTNNHDINITLLQACGVAVVVSVTSFMSGYMLRSFMKKTKSSSTSSSPNQTTTPAEAEAKLWTLAEGALSVAILNAADQLNLFELLYQHSQSSTASASRPGITSRQLASSQNWNERYVREVLLQLCGAGICQYNNPPINGKGHENENENDEQEGTFELRSVYAPLLRDPDTSSKSLVGLFPFVSALTKRSSAVVQAVKTGMGVDYDLNGSDINDAINRKNKNFFRTTLIDDVLPSIIIPQTSRPLLQRLESGINVADIGCGYGASTIAMAKKFPNSTFYAFESSRSALIAIRKAVKEHQLEHNVVVCDVSQRTVDDGPINSSEQYFDFVYTHDVLHDMTNPRQLIKDVKNRLDPHQGCWFIVDINCQDNIQDNINQPKSGMLYAFSCLLCLSNSTSTPDGEGLGTCGFPPSLAKKWMTAAGFQHFSKIQISALPYNACYLVA